MFAFSGGSDGKASAYHATRVQSLGQEDLLEKEKATHSSILAWRIPWTEEAEWLQFTGLQRVGHYCEGCCLVVVCGDRSLVAEHRLQGLRASVVEA